VSDPGNSPPSPHRKANEMSASFFFRTVGGIMPPFSSSLLVGIAARGPEGRQITMPLRFPEVGVSPFSVSFRLGRVFPAGALPPPQTCHAWFFPPMPKRLLSFTQSKKVAADGLSPRRALSQRRFPLVVFPAALLPLVLSARKL